MNKQNEQMYILLSICLVLHPMRIDESVHSQLREKHGDRMLKMQKGEMSEFENSFSYACPKFLSPVPPNYDAPPANFHKVKSLKESPWSTLACLAMGMTIAARSSMVHC